MKLLLTLLLVVSCNVFFTFCESSKWRPGYNYPQPIPQEVMVDAVNYIGLVLLQAHNQNNENNIALSPYGATSVLVALTEGVQGPALDEILRASFLPLDIQITRVGLRDIHRHLKSYFIPQEGFLAGLTLSHDNVTLKSSYENVIRFYGYDVDSFNSALYPDPYSSTTSTTTTTTEKGINYDCSTMTTTLTTENDKPSTISTTQENTDAPSTTTESPDRQTTILSSITDTPTTVTPSPDPKTDITSTIAPKEETTTELVTTSTISTDLESAASNFEVQTVTPIFTKETTQLTESTPTEEISTPPSTSITATPSSVTYFVEQSTTPLSTTESTTITTTAEETASTSYNTEEITSTTTTFELINDITPLMQKEDLTASTTATNTILDEEFTTIPVSMSKNVTYSSNVSVAFLEEDNIRIAVASKNESREESTRNTRSIIDYLIAKYHDNTYSQEVPNYEPSSVPSFAINGNLREPNISFMTYDAVLPFRYVAYLNALALVFPWIVQNNLTSTTLKQIIYNLQLTRVKATIPSFMLKGYVVLTPTLQKLGIKSIFEPRHADFSRMTDDKNIYVTNIEQAITVTIRNYVDPESLQNNDYFRRKIPVEFKVDHPFLYFVMDSEIHVALMAGKIINPLNSRIR